MNGSRQAIAGAGWRFCRDTSTKRPGRVTGHHPDAPRRAGGGWKPAGREIGFG
jgi:hypothetical protein